jgi:outer membrane protein
MSEAGAPLVLHAQRSAGPAVGSGMMTPRSFLRLALAVLAAAVAMPAVAQEESGGHLVTIGAGPQIYPKYPGADSYGLYPMLIGGLRRPGEPMPFSAPDQGFSVGLLGHDRAVDFGPVLGFQSKREERDVGAPVGDVGLTVEAGGFAQLWLGRNLRLRADLRRGLGGHKGLIGDVGADLVLRDGDRYIFSIGPRARFSSGRYQNAYFRVTPAAALASGLPAYDPSGGGFHAVGVQSSLTWRMGRDWGFYGYAGYDRLIGDAARSPIVRDLGARDQFSGGLGLFYEFHVGF